MTTKRPKDPVDSNLAHGRRLRALAVQLADREHRAQLAIAAATGTAPRARGHVLPLHKIEDEARRLEVWRARVERLEALLDRTGRKRETRAKIVVGAALLAEARARGADDDLLALFIDILDRRVERPSDRLALAETLGLALDPLKARSELALPDFEAMLPADILGGSEPVSPVD
jgi:hypothetical protein